MRSTGVLNCIDFSGVCLPLSGRDELLPESLLKLVLFLILTMPRGLYCDWNCWDFKGELDMV